MFKIFDQYLIAQVSNTSHPQYSLIIPHLLGLVAGKLFHPPITTCPSHSSQYSSFPAVQPSKGDDFYSANYFFLFLVAELRIDPALKPSPGSVIVFSKLGTTEKSPT
jgi:hypothetical protein